MPTLLLLASALAQPIPHAKSHLGQTHYSPLVGGTVAEHVEALGLTFFPTL